jgi:putative colanic acid biosynthesis glycosyltransferase
VQLDIITIHLNDFESLKRTVNSLDALTRGHGVNWILVDGASKISEPDQAELFSTLTKKASQFISEPDDGIYHAMNKGTRLSRGDYVLYLNAGDELHPEFCLEKLRDEIRESTPDMIWGTCYERFRNQCLVKVKNRSPELSWYGIPVNHQNVLFRRDRLGSSPYDDTYRYCADYDLISRLLVKNGAVHQTSMPIAIFQRGGISSLNFRETMREEERLRTRHFGVNRPTSRVITYLKIVNNKIGQIPTARRLLRKWF